MSGWKSRWSWLRLVKTAAAQWIPSARRSSSACEEISIAHATSPRVEHLAERALEVDRLRRRALHRAALAADDRGHRAEQAAPHPGRLEHRAHEPGRRRLAARARHPHDPQLGGRVAVEARGRLRHRRAHVLDLHLRHAEPERAADDERRRAALDRVRARSRGPSRVKPGTQKNSVPGSTLRLSKARPVISTSGPSPSSSRSVIGAECMGAPGRTAGARSGPRGARAWPAPRRRTAPAAARAAAAARRSATARARTPPARRRSGRRR